MFHIQQSVVFKQSETHMEQQQLIYKLKCQEN